MGVSSRFVSPTSGFALDELLGNLRTTFWASLCLGALLHLALVAIDPFKERAAKAPKPFTTKFIKREPRLTKPLELRKIPQPKRKMVKREVRLSAARMDHVQATATFNTGAVIANVASPGVHLAMGREGTSSIAAFRPPPIPVNLLASSRTPESKIDMALEMMDVNSMDTGRYRAMVVQDPVERQNITGFVRFAHVLSARGVEFGSGGINSYFIDNVTDALNELTGIKAEYEGYITLDDDRLMEIPVLFGVGGCNKRKRAGDDGPLPAGRRLRVRQHQFRRTGEVRRAGCRPRFLDRAAIRRPPGVQRILRHKKRGALPHYHAGQRQAIDQFLAGEHGLLRQGASSPASLSAGGARP